MNEWSERTLRLVLEQDYLDRLQEIYPQEEGERDVDAYKVFILDGIHWIERGSEQHRRIKYGSAAIFSVLLLHDYLKSIPQ